MPDMTAVLSSHVLEIGYDGKSELHVRYAPSAKHPAGPLVTYLDVDPETAHKVMSSPSIGAALHSDIKDKFPAIMPQVRPTPEREAPATQTRQAKPYRKVQRW